MEAMRPVEPDEFGGIPGLRLLTHVGELHSEPGERGSTHRVRAVVHISPDEPIMRGRHELTHCVLLEAANNISHWITNQVPMFAGKAFKPPIALPRDMGRPSLKPGVDIQAEGEICFQHTGGRWRAEVRVCFLRPDGSRAETVDFPLVERS